MPTILGDKAFAFLLCNFKDSSNPKPFSLAQAQAGLTTIRQFWSETSYGACSLAGTTLNDWITLPITKSDFIATYRTRSGMIQYAKDKSGIDQSKYVGFIVIFSDGVGTAWTQGNGAIFEPTILRTALICHEMTHILGEPTHSFDLTTRQTADWSAPGEYWDQTDLMSAGNCWSTPTSATDPFAGHGPQHCMMWKAQFGWLRGGRAFRIANSDLERPYNLNVRLLKRQQPVPDSDGGYKAIFFRDMSIEFATQDGFDAGLQGSGVLIHQRSQTGGQPYVLVPDVTGNPDQKFWWTGDVCVREAVGVDAGDNYYIWVREINLSDGYAMINVANGVVPPFARVQIRAVREGYSRQLRHTYIDSLGVSDPSAPNGLAAIPRITVVDWIENGRNTFFVQGVDGVTAEVVVEQHWIRTVSDGSTANNLYSLPTF
ncbi:uncharacterized protein A1O9_09578 [Exophiala aquamarina CBS 119918]|uniref:Peptidase M11 gametolysin domain-containing protein n=1 Tax=Exophiala aquamarina CBS 119918 TaxID=1182545 RepID=A0A072P3X7_9EURO|nr:uncharacterized protein A1O9_09578 [Exophiala aquamarina CBS 119918]KEF54412.1 hypothetical protein A1O9_09578 [Exophiala aquamarina CBS 119918]